jgi:NhaA family Na+:H+ antiporter
MTLPADSAVSPASRTPAPLAERLLGPFERFAARETSGGLVLLLCAVAAVVWANSRWADSYHHLWETEFLLGAGTTVARFTLHQAINDGLMVVFFFLVGLEIKREILVGELASLKQAALPMAGALGGMLVPAALYFAVNPDGPGAHGWGIPMATDIAFALGVLALLGNRVPTSLKVFLAALAIADDIGAVLVIALFYSTGVQWMPIAAVGALLLLALGANAAGVRKTYPYAMLGVAMWLAVIASGVHATIAGVLLAFTIPSRTRIDEREFLASASGALQRFDQALQDVPPGSTATVQTNTDSQEAVHALETLCEQAQTPLHRLEHSLHGVVALGIMPLFALANAGVSLQGELLAAFGSPVTMGIMLGLVLGKPVGITLAAWLAVKTGIATMPANVSWRALHFVGWLGGIGFTMSLFVANLAFVGPTAPALLDSARLGVFTGSIVAGLVGYFMLLYGARTRPLGGVT